MMKRFFYFIGLLFISIQAFSQVLEPVKWSFDFKQEGEEVQLIFKANIEDQWHLYDTDLPDGGPVPTSIHYSDSSRFVLVGDLQKTPAPTEKFDETFQMDLRFFSKQVELVQPIRLKTDQPFELSGYVEFMCCDDETCLPPTEADFSFQINEKDESAASSTDASEEPAASSIDAKEESAAPVKIVTGKGKEASPETLWLFFFFSFLAGLAAILTPCVFPMIPMTVSFFMKGGKSKLKSRLQAVFYGLSIIVIYTVVGTLVAVLFGPDAANWLSTHWLPNILFFLVFMLFAFSFFGMFEIVLPSWLVNKSDSQVDKGGFWGSFFMALTLVLVSFSCTGPIVGAILVESAGGAVLKPIVGMFGFALAFALPFTLFALFPGWLSNLPKSGGWLNSVKVVLGFLELALGLKFLSIADQTYHW